MHKRGRGSLSLLHKEVVEARQTEKQRFLGGFKFSKPQNAASSTLVRSSSEVRRRLAAGGGGDQHAAMMTDLPGRDGIGALHQQPSASQADPAAHKIKMPVIDDTPDLLPPLVPPEQEDAAAESQTTASNESTRHGEEHRGLRSSEVATHDVKMATRQTAKDDSHREAPTVARRLPNLGIEAEEERAYLAGDFGQEKATSRSGRGTMKKAAQGKSRSVSRSRQRHGPSSRRSNRRDAIDNSSAPGMRERVLHFTPSWFSVTMGTGVISSLLLLLPWEPLKPGLKYPAAVWLVADILLFIFFSVAFLARYAIFPQVLPLTIKHPQKSMFLGTVPMGLIVIISNICQLGTVEFGLGPGPALAAAGLWWFAVALSMLTAIGVPYVVTTYQSHSFSSTTAALLLPIVPPITAAATGSTIATALANAGYPTYAFTIVIVSYMVLGVGLPLALLILVLYFQRLLLFKQPPREVIISVFLPLGPCGQGGEALLHLGQVAYQLFPTISSVPGTGVAQLSLPVGQSLFGAGLLGALMLWALGIWWLFLAVATLISELRRGRLRFNMGWWASTFPLGSMAICTARLAEVLDSLAMRIVYTAFFLLTLGVWFVVAIPTFIGFVNGSLLTRKAAPCIADLPLDPLKRTSEEEEEYESWEEQREPTAAVEQSDERRSSQNKSQGGTTVQPGPSPLGSATEKGQ